MRPYVLQGHSRPLNQVKYVSLEGMLGDGFMLCAGPWRGGSVLTSVALVGQGPSRHREHPPGSVPLPAVVPQVQPGGRSADHLRKGAGQSDWAGNPAGQSGQGLAPTVAWSGTAEELLPPPRLQDKVVNLWWTEDGQRAGTFNGHTGAVWTSDISCECLGRLVCRIFEAGRGGPGKCRARQRAWGNGGPQLRSVDSREVGGRFPADQGRDDGSGAGARRRTPRGRRRPTAPSPTPAPDGPFPDPGPRRPPPRPRSPTAPSPSPTRFCPARR